MFTKTKGIEYLIALQKLTKTKTTVKIQINSVCGCRYFVVE